MASCFRLANLASAYRNKRNGILLLVFALIAFTNCFLIMKKNLPLFQGERTSVVKHDSGTGLLEVPNLIDTGVRSRETQMGKVITGKSVIVLYNAVPKTGSRTFEYLVREFAVTKNPELTPIAFPESLTNDVKQLEEFLLNLNSGSFVRGHFPFTNITRQDGVKVVYINSLRNPVERLISNYYYDIYGDGSTFTQRKSDVQYHEETIDECIEKKGNSFNYVYQYYKRQTFYIFCGNHPSWKEYNRETLERAKRVLDNYLIVGEIEEFRKIVAMIQVLLPDYFRNLTSALQAVNARRSRQFHTSKKIPPKNTTIAFLKEDLKLEIEFYEYAMNRFRTLVEKLL